jgi:hypothetical protein
VGYQRKGRRRTLTLKFADPDYEGFVVVVRRMSIDDTTLFNEYDLREWEEKVRRDEVTKAEFDDHMAAMWARLADAIESWNLEDDADPPNPIPVSVAAIRAEDPDFFWTIVRAWILGMLLRVDDHTKAPSSDGKPSEELQMPEAQPLPSRAS